MATYEKASPYFTTGKYNNFLDVYQHRKIPKLTDDAQFTITESHKYRPDLLAHDLYDNAGLWWVFYQRNPNTLTAPPTDFQAGTPIYLPKLETLKTVLGF